MHRPQASTSVKMAAKPPRPANRDAISSCVDVEPASRHHLRQARRPKDRQVPLNPIRPERHDGPWRGHSRDDGVPERGRSIRNADSVLSARPTHPRLAVSCRNRHIRQPEASARPLSLRHIKTRLKNYPIKQQTCEPDRIEAFEPDTRQARPHWPGIDRRVQGQMGLSWQITPLVLMQAITHPHPAAPDFRTPHVERRTSQVF